MDQSAILDHQFTVAAYAITWAIQLGYVALARLQMARAKALGLPHSPQPALKASAFRSLSRHSACGRRPRRKLPVQGSP